MDDRPPSTSVPPAPPRRETVPAGEKALRLVAAVLLAAGGTWLVYHFHRLVLDTGPTRAIDLRLRIREVVAWFDGVPVYETMSDAVYPPASYVMLWPVLGLLDMGAARVAWALGAAMAARRTMGPSCRSVPLSRARRQAGLCTGCTAVDVVGGAQPCAPPQNSRDSASSRPRSAS